jgi:hypothetical protein
MPGLGYCWVEKFYRHHAYDYVWIVPKLSNMW